MELFNFLITCEDENTNIIVIDVINDDKQIFCGTIAEAYLGILPSDCHRAVCRWFVDDNYDFWIFIR